MGAIKKTHARTLTASMKRFEGSASNAHVSVFFFTYLRWSLTSSQLMAATATLSVDSGSLLNCDSTTCAEDTWEVGGGGVSGARAGGGGLDGPHAP